MFFELLDTAAKTADASQETNVWQMVITIGIWVVVIGAAYFMFIRPQKKKQQQEEELRNNIEIGDDVTTIGGIVGRVIAVREDDTFVLETGSDKTRMRFRKWAISSVDTPDKQPKDTKKDDNDKKEKKKKSSKKDEEKTEE